MPPAGLLRFYLVGRRSEGELVAPSTYGGVVAVGVGSTIPVPQSWP